MADKNTPEFCDRLAKASFSEMEAVGKTAHKSGLFAGLSSAEQATVVAATGAELGIPPMAALRGISIVDGKIIMSADMMSALVWRNLPGATVEVTETTDESCTVLAARPGRQPISITWTIADAERADLAGGKKANWRKYPRAMLRARALSEAVRAVFPDILFGIYAPEEFGHEPKADFEIEPKFAPLVDAKPRPIANSKPKTTTAEPVRVEAVVEPQAEAAMAVIEIEPKKTKVSKTGMVARSACIGGVESTYWVKDPSYIEPEPDPPSRPTPEEQRDWMAEAIERSESMAELGKLGAQIKGMALPQDYVAVLRSAYAIRKSLLDLDLKRKSAKELDFSDAEEFDRDL